MRTLTAIESLADLPGPQHLAIGVFDGVHRGHQAVLRSAVDAAHAVHGTAIVVTFDPHPAEILAPDKAPKRLTSLRQQTALFDALGFDALLAIPFSRSIAGQSPDAFIAQLQASGRLAGIHVGVDWAFGKGRAGNVTLLAKLGQQHGFQLRAIEPVLHEEQRISSTAIRTALAAGELEDVASLLGRPYRIAGNVVTGDQLGRQLGFPTANIALEVEALPPHGVYVVHAELLPHQPYGVANLGVRPSIGGSLALRFEVHFLDWPEADLYGKDLEVTLLHHLRGEQRFDGLPALQSQIARDLQAAREWIAENTIPETVFVAVQSSAQIARVAALAREIWTDHYVSIIGQDQVDYMLDKIQSPAAISEQIHAGTDYVLIECGQEIVGYLATIANPQKRSVHLSKLYVRRACQGKGIGKAMLDHIEQRARQAGCDTLWLTVNKDNAASIAWYQRQGFRRTAAICQEIGEGFVMDDYRMEKMLSGQSQPRR